MAAAGLFIITALIAWYLYKGGGVSCVGDAPGHCDCQTVAQGNQMRFGYDDLVTLAQNAGFGSDSNIAAAIAIAESNKPATNPPTGNSEAYNPESQDNTPCGEGSYGLWQIDRKWHPEFACMDLTDPQTNANAAYKVYNNAGGFHPWSTYKNGSYQNFLQ